MARAHDPILARAVAMRIVARLRELGHTAYFAGGCVRDELLGQKPTDYDVATSAKPAQVADAFDRTHAVGEHFGVMLVRMDSCTVEVATFRADGVYTDSRRPDAVRFADAQADAQRRDFTINALFLDPSDATGPDGVRGRVIDFVGGLTDLQARVIRAVGDPDLRLNEDHLRALRAVRFTARLGFALDPATAAAIKRHARELRGVSRERIGDELRRMLGHPSRAAAARLIESLTLDAPVLDEPNARSDLATLTNLPHASPTRAAILNADFTKDLAPVSPMVALAAWCIDRHGQPFAGVKIIEEPIQADMLRRLRRGLCLSNDERDELADTIQSHRRLVQGSTSLGIAQRKRLAAANGFTGAFAVISSQIPARSSMIASDLGNLRHIGGGVAPVALVTGDDLIAIGLRSGPRFKTILDQLYDTQLEGRMNTKQELLELARSLSV